MLVELCKPSKRIVTVYLVLNIEEKPSLLDFRNGFKEPISDNRTNDVAREGNW